MCAGALVREARVFGRQGDCGGLTPAWACCMVGRRSTSTGLLALDTGTLSGSVGYQGPLKGWGCLHACLHAARELGCGQSMGWAGCILSVRETARGVVCLLSVRLRQRAARAASGAMHACRVGGGAGAFLVLELLWLSHVYRGTSPPYTCSICLGFCWPLLFAWALQQGIGCLMVLHTP